MGSTEDLLTLRDDTIGECDRGTLHKERTKVVFGYGNPDAELMLIGEAPGETEDKEGQPFVGKAGRLLTKVLSRLGFTRDDVYIANVIKCHPPMNRDPRREEIKTCSPFLFQQIQIIQPVAIVTLGRFAGGLLTYSPGMPMRHLRNEEWVYDKGGYRAWLVATYHPSWILRKQGQDLADGVKMLYTDIARAKGLLGEPLPAQEDESYLEDLFSEM